MSHLKETPNKNSAQENQMTITEKLLDEDGDEGAELINGLLCRPVRLEDKPNIVDIEVYAGRDYLQALFDDLFHEDRYFPCLMYCGIDKDGILVTFVGLMITDGGHSAQFVARRTRSGYESRGYSTTLKRYAVAMQRRRLQSVRNYYSVVGQSEFTQHCICVAKRHTILAEIPQTNVILPSTPDVTVLKRLQPSQAADYILTNCRHLFPDNIMIAFYKNLVISLSNLQKLHEMNNVFVHLNADSTAKSLSYRITYHSPQYLVSHIDVMTEDESELLLHLQAHLAEIKTIETLGKELAIWVSVLPSQCQKHSNWLSTCKQRFSFDFRELHNMEVIDKTALVLKELNEVQGNNIFPS